MGGVGYIWLSKGHKLGPADELGDSQKQFQECLSVWNVLLDIAVGGR